MQFAWFINLLYVDVNSDSDMAIFGEHVRTTFVCLSNICFGKMLEIASAILPFEADFAWDKLCLFVWPFWLFSTIKLAGQRVSKAAAGGQC